MNPPALEEGGKQVCRTMSGGQVIPRQWQGPPVFGSKKAMLWLHVAATPQPSIIVQVVVMTGQLVTTLTTFVTIPTVQQVFVQPGGPKIQFVALHGRTCVGGQRAVNTLVETPVLNVTVQKAELPVRFSIKVKLIAIELHTGVPGGGFWVQVKPGGGTTVEE